MKNVMFASGLLAVMLLLAFGALPGCGEKEESRSNPGTVSKEDIKEEAMEAYDTAKAYTQDQMQAFHEQMKTRLSEYNDDIDQLQVKVEELGGDAKIKAEQQMTALRQKRDEASKKLQELSSSGENSWEQLKSGIDAVMEDLGTAYKKVAAEFSKS